MKNSIDAKAREIATFDSIWKWDLIKNEAEIWCDQARMLRCSENSQKNAILFVRDIFRIENKRLNADCAIQSLWNKFFKSSADKMTDLNSFFWFWCSSCTRNEAYDDERVVAKVFECKWLKKAEKEEKIDDWIKVKLNFLKIRSISVRKTSERIKKEEKKLKKKFWQQNISINLRL